MSLISEDELQELHEKYHRENPEVLRSRCLQCKQDRQAEIKRATEFICARVREDSAINIKELAFAVSRRPAWVRHVLEENGLSAPEAPRVPWVPKSQRPCANCGHIRCRHCKGTLPRRHVNPTLLGWYVCPRRPHCVGEVEIAPEVFSNCACSHYTTRSLR